MTQGIGAQEGSIPALIFDILETWCGDWLTIEQLTIETQRIRPDTNPTTINRNVWRLARAGRIQYETQGRGPGSFARFQVTDRAYLRERTG